MASTPMPILVLLNRPIQRFGFLGIPHDAATTLGNRSDRRSDTPGA
jgi:hypothetical protein